MTLRKKINIFLLLFVILIIIPTVIILILSFREYSINNAISKAELVANIVKDGLTVHMENGIMDKRDRFLSKITRIHEVNNLRILRSPSVDRQFGKSVESYQKIDDLEKSVLESGQKRVALQETKDKVLLKTVIPYIASSYDEPNCLKCHQAKEGEVLGAISMEFDITDVRTNSLATIGKIVLFILLASLLAFFMVNRFVKQYVEFFENLKALVQNAYDGDYIHRLKIYKDGELKETTEWINTLFDKIEESLKSIQKSVNYFLAFHDKNKDPLIHIKEIVYELAAIYKFKNIIEKDKDLEKIYGRIIELLKNKYNIENFIFYEIDKKSGRRNILYRGIEEPICSKADSDISLCRAERTGEIIYSDKYIQVCEAAETDKFYICVPLHISSDFSLVITFVANSKEEYNKLKCTIQNFENYLNVVKNPVQTHLLLQELKEMSLKDRMTGAYNRRYLDIFVKDAIPKAIRVKSPYAVMMIDIDYFKMVNDTFGHDAGDRVIKELVNTIFENIRESDVVVRFGGEEFLVLLYNCHKEDAKKVAETIRKSFENKKIDVGSEKITKTISIGISEFPTDSEQFWQTIKFADMALYNAKESGRNRVVVYKEEDFQAKKEQY